MRIALDAMGGDYAPGPIVAGAVQAVADNPEMTVVLVGDQAQVALAVAAAGGRIGDQIELFHCTQTVSMEESPVEALRKKPDNSISRTWQLLAERRVDAIVSAGNTGRMVAGGLRLRRFLKGVRRPGIATIMPTLKGPCVLIDVGANVAPNRSIYFAYGVMGAIFATHIFGRERPTIGLMNVGSEEAKGTIWPRRRTPYFTTARCMTSSSVTLKAVTSTAGPATWWSPKALSATWCSKCAKGCSSS